MDRAQGKDTPTFAWTIPLPHYPQTPANPTSLTVTVSPLWVVSTEYLELEGDSQRTSPRLVVLRIASTGGWCLTPELYPGCV